MSEMETIHVQAASWPVKHDGMEPVVTELKHVIENAGKKREANMAFVADQVLTEQECKQIIKAGENAGFENVAKAGYPKEYRSNDRALFTSEALANKLWDRVKDMPFAKQPLVLSGCLDNITTYGQVEGTWRAVGINPMFRMYRYTQGQSFAPHEDNFVQKDINTRTFLSILVYLNEDYEGGETRFLKRNKHLLFREPGKEEDTENILFANKAHQGSILVLTQQSLLHDAAPVPSGTKLAMRSDIFFERVNGTPQQSISHSIQQNLAAWLVRKLYQFFQFFVVRTE